MTLYMYSGEQGGGGPHASYDPPKLYSLELDVRSYERLRRQESLLVDFTEFLNNMVWLLEQACGALRDSASRGVPAGLSTTVETKATRTFRAVLCGGVDPLSTSKSTTLQIKEHTAFRELAHLTLPIQENTDRGMAKFLSGRVRELVEENQRYQTRVHALEEDSRAFEQQISALQQQMSADTSLHSNEASSWKMQCDMLRSQVASAKEQHEFLKEQARVAEMGASRDRSQLVEVEAACSAMRGEIAELKDKVESHVGTIAELEETKIGNEREISRLRDLCEGYKSASGMADARVEDWKRMAKSHEERSGKMAQEVLHLEQKLAKASHDLEQAKRHMHETEHRAAQRDVLVQTQEEALQSAQSRVTDLQQQQRKMGEELDDARKQLEEAKKQAAETTKKCENSEKMIVWLNKQLTSIQLGGSGGTTAPIKSKGKIETSHGNGIANGLANGTGKANAEPPTAASLRSSHGGVMKTSTPSPLQPHSRLARAGS